MIDLLIIGLYLLVMLCISLYFGFRTKTMREYAVANKAYSTPILVSAIIGTTIGGYATIGLAGQAYQVGLLAVFVFLAFVSELLLIAKFLAPQIAQFPDAISPGDIMDHYYGPIGRFITGFAGTCKCVGVVAAQITAVGLLLQYFLEVPQIWAVVMGCTAVVLYSALGGIKAVTLTDIIQTVMVIICVLTLFNVGLLHVGGYQALFSSIPATHFDLWPNSTTALKYFSLILLGLLPMLDPSHLQRYLVAKDEQQLKTALRYSAFVNGLVRLMAAGIGLMALSLAPDLAPKMAFPHMIGLLQVGLKGFVIVGMVAVILSTGDSYLNVGGITFVRDFWKPLFKKPFSDRTELRLTQISTLFLGAIAIVVTMMVPSIFDIVIASRFLWVSLISVPLLAGLLGCRASRRTFISGLLAGGGCYTIWLLLFEKEWGVESIAVGFIANAIAFSILYRIETKKDRPTKNRTFPINFFKVRFFVNSFQHIQSYIPTWQGVLRFSSARTELHGAQYALFGCFACFNFFLPYMMWGNSIEALCPHATMMRFLGGFLCCFLCFNKGWPTWLRSYLPIFWHLTLLYSIPFLMTFVVLETNASWSSLNHMLLGLFLLGFLVDWMSFLVILALGVLLACAAFSCIDHLSSVTLDSDQVRWAIYMYSFAAAISMFFGRANAQSNLDRENISKAVGCAVIHELHTLLASLSILIGELQKDLVVLIQGYQLALQAKLFVKKIPEQRLMGFEELTKSIGSQVKLSLGTMAVFLNYLKEEAAKTPPELCSALQCLTLTLERYSFQNNSERKLVWLNIEQDFYFMGHQGVLMNMLFNLIRNALKQIHKAKKGNIKIWIETTSQGNEIHVRDTANGMTEAQLDKIFTPFSSGDQQGTGLGLYFCKQEMRRIHGDVLCRSVYGEFAEFILVFQEVSPDETNTLLSVSHHNSSH